MNFKRKILKIIVLSLICTVCAAGTLFAIQANTELTLGEIDIKEEYTINDTLTIPSTTLTYMGETKDAECIIYYPSGAAYKLESAKLNELGEYKLEYSAYFNERKHTKVVTFVVNNTLYKIENGDFAFADYYDEYILKEYDGSESYLKGIFVELPKGSTFVYNKIIDVSQMTSADNLIRFSILPNQLGFEDYQYLNIRLTDIYDPSNYVTVSFHDMDRKELIYGVVNDYNRDLWGTYAYTLTNAYVKAGANKQPMVGIEGSKIHVDNPYGLPTGLSFHGVPSLDKLTGLSVKKIEGASTTLSFDYATRGVYIKYSTDAGLICDLDDTSYFNNPWGGFTTGEVYLSIWMDDYTSANSGRLFIYDIVGDDLSAECIYDEEAPRLTIDYQGLDKSNLPNGISGYHYPLFKASAIDSIDGVCDVKTIVYYNYRSSNRSITTVSNGGFTPNKSGMYTVVNTSTDAAGNKAVETYDIYVESEDDPIKISINDRVESCAIGQTVNLGVLDVNLDSNLYTYSISVQANGKIYELGENAQFTPNQNDTHIVTFTVKDFLGRSFTESYSFTVTNDNVPVIFEEAFFDKYFVSGQSYELPVLKAYDFKENPEGDPIIADVYISDANGRYKNEGDRFVPKASQSGDTVTIEYVVNDHILKSYSIPCYLTKNGNDFLMEEFFATTGMNKEATSSGVVFTTETEGATLEFINAVLAQNFYLEFSVDSSKNNFKAIEIYFKDSVNESQTLTIRFERAADKSRVLINGVEYHLKIDSSFTNSDIPFKIEYDYAKNIITTNDDLGTSIKVTDFEGFDSNKIYVSLRLIDVDDESAIKISNFDGQPINNKKIDAISPKVVFSNEFSRYYSLNTVVTLLDAWASDVLSSDVKFTLTVKGPNGIVTAVDGTELNNVEVGEYDIKLSSYGKYTVTYTATDGIGKSRIYPMTFEVNDEIAPVINVDKSAIKAKVGDKVTIPVATAEDNIDGEVKVFVFLKSPTGKTIELVGSENNAKYFTANVKGKYTIQYLAYDSFGNMKIETVYVTVR